MPLFHVRNSRREGIVKIQPSKINMKLQKKLKNCHSITLFFHRQENLRSVFKSAGTGHSHPLMRKGCPSAFKNAGTDLSHE